MLYPAELRGRRASCLGFSAMICVLYILHKTNPHGGQCCWKIKGYDAAGVSRGLKDAPTRIPQGAEAGGDGVRG